MDLSNAILNNRKIFGKASNKLETISETAIKSINKAINFYEPNKIYLMFSGGNDSAVLVDWFNKAVKDFVDIPVKCGHLDTGIGIEQTRKWAKEFSEKRNIPFHRVSIQDVKEDDNYSSVMTYKELVKKFGFPGPANHKMAYDWLKFRPLLKMTKDAKEGYHDRILYLTGVRKDESNRRMGTTIRYQRDGARVWNAPIMHWKDVDMMKYRKFVDIERNEVADMIHMSGECLCGAFATGEEREEIRFFFPEVIEQIEEIEEEVEHEYRCGKSDISEFDHTQWAHGNANDDFCPEDHPMYDSNSKSILCTGCGDRFEQRSNND